MNDKNLNANKLIIWRISDSRPGHDTQSRGLAQAISRIRASKCIDIAARTPMQNLWAMLTLRFSTKNNLAPPDLILGAGHGTHLTMLAARRVLGGKAIVLMSPSLPTSWFDCCLIPSHDTPREKDNIITTQGALNTVVASGQNDPEKGLILLGGESRHYGWDNNEMIRQIKTIINSDQRQWQISDSPRTPEETKKDLDQLVTNRISFVPFGTATPEWLRMQLGLAGVIWVSEDSISMISEALTTGAHVGVLNVPVKKNGQTIKTIKELADKKFIKEFNEWQIDHELMTPHRILNEASRCAKLIMSRFGF